MICINVFVRLERKLKELRVQVDLHGGWQLKHQVEKRELEMQRSGVIGKQQYTEKVDTLQVHYILTGDIIVDVILVERLERIMHWTILMMIRQMNRMDVQIRAQPKLIHTRKLSERFKVCACREFMLV